MSATVSVKPRVTLWKLVVSAEGWASWEPTLECGHVHYGPYYPSGNLPLNLECYRCQDRAAKALKAG